MKTDLLKKVWLPHVLIWASYFILLVWFYGETRSFEPTLLKSLFILIIQAGIFYLNLGILLPRFFERGRYGLYGLIVFVILVISLVLFYLFDRFSLYAEYQRAVSSNDFSMLPRGFREFGHHHGPPPWAEPFRFHYIWRQLLFHGFFVVIVLFISTIYYNIVISGKKEKEALELRSRVVEAESNMLKSQINPHFLFNTLNNIYSMAQLKSDQAPESIHRLSEMLRYVIYDCNEKFVRLGQETRYLKSYIELQLMKEEKMENVKYDFSNINPNLPIAPLILIPFVENSFKHSRIENVKSHIEIALNTTGKNLHFHIQNSIPENEHRKEKTGGIGLENVKRRLQLLYPGKHSLEVTVTDKSYQVDLNLELHED